MPEFTDPVYTGPSIPVKRCVFRVVAVDPPGLFSYPSVHRESSHAQLDRIDAFDPAGISPSERYEFYYYEPGLVCSIEVNNIIAITFDQCGVVDKVERVDIEPTKKAKAGSVK